MQGQKWEFLAKRRFSVYAVFIILIALIACFLSLSLHPELAAAMLFILGIGIGLLVNEITSFAQYEKSTSYYRLVSIKKATHELLKPGAQTGQLRSKYRYSFGVIIDNLRNLEQQIATGTEWPALTERNEKNNTDGWALFDRYVRHIAADISPYVWAVPELQILSKVCISLETVVSTLDAALENPSVIEIDDRNRVSVREGIDANEPRIEAMRDAYNDLNMNWNNWRILCKQ